MKEVEGPNCGAAFEAREDKCPYCGHINPMGAEAKFLRELEDKRKDLDNVDEEAREAYKEEIKKGAGSAFKPVIVVLLVIALLIGFFVLMDKIIFNPDRGGSVADEIVWEHEAFAEYDELFAAEKYEELMERIANDGSEDHDVWNWEHYDEFMGIADELWGSD